MTNLGLIVNGILALGLLIAYVVLTALGDDANAILALLGGQLIAVGASRAAEQVSSRGTT